MMMRSKLLCAIAMSGFAALLANAPAQALTAQECSAKYQAAKKDGSLGTTKWNDFRKAQCGADATPAATPTAAAPAAPAEKKKGLLSGFIDKIKQVTEDPPVATAATAAAVVGVLAGQRLEQNKGQRPQQPHQGPEDQGGGGGHGPGSFGRS